MSEGFLDLAFIEGIYAMILNTDLCALGGSSPITRHMVCVHLLSISWNLSINCQSSVLWARAAKLSSGSIDAYNIIQNISLIFRKRSLLGAAHCHCSWNCWNWNRPHWAYSPLEHSVLCSEPPSVLLTLLLDISCRVGHMLHQFEVLSWPWSSEQ